MRDKEGSRLCFSGKVEDTLMGKGSKQVPQGLTRSPESLDGTTRKYSAMLEVTFYYTGFDNSKSYCLIKRLWGEHQ